MKPPNMADAIKRGLVTEPGEGIHTFSNGSHWEGWASGNCLECKYYELDGEAGEFCAFESAAMLGIVSPALALLFGWKQTTTEYGPRFAWDEPPQCRFFASNDSDDGDHKPRPKPICPSTLSLFADQRTTHDIAAPVGKGRGKTTQRTVTT